MQPNQEKGELERKLQALLKQSEQVSDEDKAEKDKLTYEPAPTSLPELPVIVREGHFSRNWRKYMLSAGSLFVAGLSLLLLSYAFNSSKPKLEGYSKEEAPKPKQIHRIWLEKVEEVPLSSIPKIKEPGQFKPMVGVNYKIRLEKLKREYEANKEPESYYPSRICLEHVEKLRTIRNDLEELKKDINDEDNPHLAKLSENVVKLESELERKFRSSSDWYRTVKQAELEYDPQKHKTPQYWQRRAKR